MSRRPSPTDIADLLQSGVSAATKQQKTGQTLSTAMSLSVTISWLMYVSFWDHWPRVIDNWESALTMVFGSFVAGSTPQGGGVVAFPVFTKILGVPGSIARLFSLSIQTVGMTAAALSIVFYRRQVAWKAVAILTPASIVGFGVTVLFLSRPEIPYRPPLLPGSYVKVFFTVVLAAMAVGLWIQYRPSVIELRTRLDKVNLRTQAIFIIFGLCGGVASALVGSGADVFAYVAIVLIAGISPRVGVPSSVIVMALVSIVGFISLGLFDLQLATGIDGSTVTSVSEQPVSLDGEKLTFSTTGDPASTNFDAFGLWVAAIPVVAWGAPLGAWASSKLTDRLLVRFVVALALLEVISTIIFLPALRTEPRLQLFALGLGTIMIGGTALIMKKRSTLAGTPEFGGDQVIVPQNVDVRADFAKKLNETDNDGSDEE